MQLNERFKDKIAIVKSSASGIDRRVACKLGKEGAKLALFDINKELLQKTGKGSLLLIASISGKEINPNMVGYSASKAGVIGLIKGMAKEFASTNITINGLAPAIKKTSINVNTSSEQLKYMIAKIPIQRLGTVEEVAAISCYIVSDENSFSTGFVSDISGGQATY